MLKLDPEVDCLCPFRQPSLKLEVCFINRSRFRSTGDPLSDSSCTSERLFASPKLYTGTGESRLTKESAVNSSMLDLVGKSTSAAQRGRSGKGCVLPPAVIEERVPSRCDAAQGAV